MNSLKLDIQPFLTTKKILEKTLKKGTSSELEEMGGVQAFEMDYELSWKTLKKLLMSKGVEVYSSKETFREAAAEGLIQEFETWGEKYLETRNLTIHSYDSDILLKMDFGKLSASENERANILLKSHFHGELAKKYLKEYKEVTAKEFSNHQN